MLWLLSKLETIVTSGTLFAHQALVRRPSVNPDPDWHLAYLKVDLSDFIVGMRTWMKSPFDYMMAKVFAMDDFKILEIFAEPIRTTH